VSGHVGQPRLRQHAKTSFTPFSSLFLDRAAQITYTLMGVLQSNIRFTILKVGPKEIRQCCLLQEV